MARSCASRTTKRTDPPLRRGCLRVIISQTFEPISRAPIDLAALDRVRKKRTRRREGTEGRKEAGGRS